MIKMNEDRKTCEAAIYQKDSLYSICSDRLDLCNEKVGEYIALEEGNKEKVRLLQEKNSTVFDELEATNKKLKRSKLKNMLVLIGAGITEILTILALI